VTRSARELENELDLEVLSQTRVEHLDLQRRLVSCSGRDYPFSKLVLALGAAPRLPAVPGLEIGPRVFAFHELADYERLRLSLNAGARVLVLGAGLIGCELGCDLSQAGFDIALVDVASEPLSALMPALVGARVSTHLQALGIETHLGGAPSRALISDHDVCLEFPCGKRLSADFLVCVTGQTPNSALAAAAGLDVDAGVVVDSTLATSSPGIYALGDCARLASFNLNFVVPIARSATALGKTVAGTPTRVVLPALAITVKMPGFPLVCSAGPRASDFRWTIRDGTAGFEALASDGNGHLRAFVLQGTEVRSKDARLAELPPLLAAP
jgi:rubredoxin-NAD+ reductase